MIEPSGQLHPDRLFAASEAIYRANEELSPRGGLTTYPPNLVGTPSQPEAFRGFTAFEIEEASHFLMRMGLIVPDEGPSSEEGRRCA